MTVAARAESQISGRRVALVIGNGAYRNVAPLSNPGNDARLIASTLKKLGFEVIGGGALLDLDRAKLSQAVQDFGHALVGADVGLFYYSGHGLQVQGVNWLVPVDANPTRPQDLDFQMVDADLVLRQMDGAGTKLNVVLLDACRNNPFAARGLRALEGGLAEMKAPEGTLISYATQPGNVAADGAGGDSPYTTALAANMQQPGVDIFRLFNQVGLQVKRVTGGGQQPWVSTSPIDGDFYFSPPPAPQVASSVAPVPVQPPPPVTVAAISALEQTRAALRDHRCSILDAKPVGNQLNVRGLALKDADWDKFLTRIGATSRGIRLDNPDVEFLQPFMCDAVDVLGPIVLATRTADGGRAMTLWRHQVRAGSSLTLTMTEVPGATVRLDLFRPDGMVEHLAARPLAASGGELRFVLPQPPTAPAGARLIAATISPTKLPLDDRPATEPMQPYLARLRQVLSQDVQADVGVYELQAAIAPVAVKPPVKAPAASDGRCGAVLERAQLGETLSDADRSFLRSACH